MELSGLGAMQNLHCCGWGELHGVQDYASNPAIFVRYMRTVALYRKGGILFSSATSAETSRTNGALRFAKDITDNELGTVTKLPSFRNPNTARYINSYQWVINREKFAAYCVANNIENRYY